MSAEQKPTMVDVLFKLGEHTRDAKVPKGASRTSLDEIAKEVFSDVLQKPDESYIFKYYHEEWKDWLDIQEGKYTILNECIIKIECVPNESATEINKGSFKAKAKAKESKPVTDVGIGPALGEKPNQKGVNKEDAPESEKHKKLLTEPIGEKPVTKLPGIGSTLGEKLNQKGVTFVQHVLGKYLTLHGNECKKNYFIEWFCMMTETGQRKDASVCYNALKDWTEKYINTDSK